MKIDGAYNINSIPKIDKFPNKTMTEVDKVNPPVRAENNPAATYQESIQDNKLKTYNLQSIEKLSQEVENFYGQLKEIVEEMLTNQDQLSDIFKVDNPLKLPIELEISEKMIMEIKDLIESEGSLGIETMSDKILDIVKKSTSGEPLKVDVLTEVIVEVFEDTELRLGSLSNLSNKTYDRIMDKLDSFLSPDNLKNLPENIMVDLKDMIVQMLTKQAKAVMILNKIGSESLDNPLIAEVKDVINIDGRLGAMAISTQVLRFVRESAEENPKKLADLINSIKKNFREVKKTLGELPELTEDTYETIIKELEKDLLELSNKGLVFFDKFMSILERVREKEFPIQRYALFAAGATLIYYGMRILL